MLRTSQRLHHNKDFIQVLKQGKRHSFGGVLLYYKENKINYTRIGFIVSKRFSLFSVKRNRQKRILRAAVKTFYEKLYPGYDIILSYTNRNKVLPYKEAVRVLTKIFEKTQLLR